MGRRLLLRANGFDRRQQAHVGTPAVAPGWPAARRRIKAARGSIAFIDDYSAWVTGPTAEANRAKRSGATFETDKTTIIHFTRTKARSSNTSFWVEGLEVKPKDSAKILGVIIDAGLRYREHVASAAAKGLTAAMGLKRLKMLSPGVARQLFKATVAPAMDYASNVWMHARRVEDTRWLNKAQRIGAQAITGVFRTVATAVSKAEASIQSVEERHRQAATRLCVNLRTLPKTHPLTTLKNKTSKRYPSPLHVITTMVGRKSTPRVGIIHEYALPPWTTVFNCYTRNSQKDSRLGMGSIVCDTSRDGADRIIATCSAAVGSSREQNLYTAELEAIAKALESIPSNLASRNVTVIPSNRSVVAAIRRPGRQSGQCTVRRIYDRVKHLQASGYSVGLMWEPANEDRQSLRALAKAAARQSTEHDRTGIATYQARSTKLRLALTRGRPCDRLPDGVGRYSKRLDKALPGTHTRLLYDSLKRSESNVLAQLRTGMMRLNSYLSKIGAVESSLCECGQATETAEHFLFRCKRWTEQRRILIACSRTKIGNLSFFMGGKTASDDDRWQPDMRAVHATIKFAIATKRLASTSTTPVTNP
ncbi:hypothetical protein Purlil1_14013 [Purpureocillium lilacinum]|uniref:Reverse transcriptase n=1 Tax=Purpureocillium lilacinum TaxID=33203 RepID=A0ABR0BCH3_PURLI|nr:hypothetical protein Purlil1_14013 [Purpureocillium lilacinum]